MQAVLEEEYMTAKQKELQVRKMGWWLEDDIMQGKRTQVMNTMKERQMKRAELEGKSGQLKSRRWDGGQGGGELTNAISA
eukprot:749773-Hanusia_phi.AAC.2